MFFCFYLIKYTPFLPNQAALLQPLTNYPGHHTMLLFLHSLGFRSQYIIYSPHKEHPEINLYATFSPLLISRNSCSSLFLLLSNHKIQQISAISDYQIHQKCKPEQMQHLFFYLLTTIKILTKGLSSSAVCCVCSSSDYQFFKFTNYLLN